MNEEPQVTLNVGGPADLLAAIPFMLGFYPADCLVVAPMGAEWPTMRCDIPLGAGGAAAVVDALMRVAPDEDLASEKICFVVGYGTGEQVTPAITAVTLALRSHGWRVHDMLRVEGGRYWSYTCRNPACCPPEGGRFDTQTHENTAKGIAAGLAPLQNRQAVCDLLSPVHEPGMTRAVEDAEQWLISTFRQTRDPESVKRQLTARARSLAERGLARHRNGLHLADKDAARLAFALTSVRVRDQIWASITIGPDLQDWLALWCDLTRRLPPRLVPPCAALAGFSAWLTGNNVLARAAFERCLHADPGYSMAQLGQKVVAAAIHPAAWEEMRQDVLPQLEDH